MAVQATNPQPLTVGVSYEDPDDYSMSDLMQQHFGKSGSHNNFTPPPGMSLTVGDGAYGKVTNGFHGTPTEAGTFTATVRHSSNYTPSFTLTFNVEEPAPEPVTAAAPVFDDDALTVTVPESPGAAYSVNGLEKPAGTYPATAGATMTVTAEPADTGYVLEGDTKWTHDYAGEPPGPDPLDLLAPDPQSVAVCEALAPRLIMHTASSDDEVERAVSAVAVVLEYVNGYTRGRGFTEMVPARDLQAVIVASSARLFTNPEQVASYTLGDYSERPAILAGWTMAEMAVLRRHRVTYR